MDTETLALVTKRTIEGVSYRDTADEIGVSRTTVMRAVNKPDIKALVEKGISQLLQRGLIPAINTHCRLAAIGSSTKVLKYTDPETGRTLRVSDTDPQLLKLSLDASKNILSHANGSGPQTVINQLIYSQGTHGQVDQEALSMVLGALRDQDNDVIDVCTTDVDGGSYGGTQGKSTK